MEKLTLEHILSFGKGLMFKDEYFIYELEAIFFDLYEERGAFLKVIDKTLTTSMWHNNTKSAKPILRPMDLTKTIIVEGKEIIPIVELAFIAFSDLDWEQGEIKKHTAISSHFTNSNFQYRNGEFITQNLNMEIVQTGNQLTLFQWLLKHKFDVFGLIEKYLAIDVNTLTTNPYN